MNITLTVFCGPKQYKGKFPPQIDGIIVTVTVRPDDNVHPISLCASKLSSAEGRTNIPIPQQVDQDDDWNDKANHTISLSPRQPDNSLDEINHLEDHRQPEGPGLEGP